MDTQLILVLHVIVCIVLIVLVLLQSGKEGMGVIFGGGSSSVLGSSGAGGILVKLTTFMAVLFVATCLSYNILTSSQHDDKSLILDLPPVDDPSQPATQTLPSAVDPSTPAPQAASEAPQVAPQEAPQVAPQGEAVTAPEAPAQ